MQKNSNQPKILPLEKNPQFLSKYADVKVWASLCNSADDVDASVCKYKQASRFFTKSMEIVGKYHVNHNQAAF